MSSRLGQVPTAGFVEEALELLLAVQGLKDLVGVYFKGSSKADFAGRLFDSLPENPPDQVVASDLVAVALLDVSFGARATDELLNAGCLNSYLALDRLPVDVDLWMALDRVDCLYDAYGLLKKLHNVGPTKASKLLARKRPRLAPIIDSHVGSFFSCAGWEFLNPLAVCLAGSPGLVGAINELRPSFGKSDDAPSTLRLLDVAIWMTRSRAKSAAEAREVVLGRREPLG